MEGETVLQVDARSDKSEGRIHLPQVKVANAKILALKNLLLANLVSWDLVMASFKLFSP